MNNKPTSFIVFGILNILFGLICSCLMGFGSAAVFIGGYEGYNTFYIFTQIILMPVMALLWLAMIANGVGLLLMKEWGRKGTVIVSLAIILLSLIDIVLKTIFELPMLMQSSGMANNQAGAAGIAVGGAVSVICGGVVRLAYPGIAAYMLSRSEAKMALQPQPEYTDYNNYSQPGYPPQPGAPDQYPSQYNEQNDPPQNYPPPPDHNNPPQNPMG